MKTGTAFHDFEERCVKPRLKESLEEMERIFQEEKDQFQERFAEDMERVCGQQNKSGSDEKTAYMDWELLRTNLSAGKDAYRIMLYGKNWFLSEGAEAGTTDVSLMMKVYHDLERQLKEDAKRYVGKITPLEVEMHTAYFVPLFHEYIKELIQYAVGDAVEGKAFRCLKKEAEFQIRVGECLEPGYLVYKENGEKNREEIISWLEKNNREAYCYEDFQNMDFSGMEYSAHDFRNTDFRDAVMEETNISFSLLTGARFTRSRLPGADLRGSVLHGADFREADLRGAHMEGTLMYDGRGGTTERRLASYPAGRFAGADLRGADFRECIYCGADFRGANLKGANFEGSSLYRCRITKEQLEEANFTEEQKREIAGKE